MNKNRLLFLVMCLFAFVSGFAQSFTDGLEWAPGTPSTSIQSPVFSAPSCQDIHYTISTTSTDLDFIYDPTAVNGQGLLFPSYTSTGASTTMDITITFNVPVQNFGLRILDLDEDNGGDQGPPEEFLSNVAPPPSSVTTLPGIGPLFLSGSTITPDDGNASNANNNPGAWVYWPGTVTTVSFTYNRFSAGYEFVLDSVHFECECPPPSDHIDDVTICPGEPTVLNATTSGATYNWSTGSTAASITTSTAGTYWVQVHIGSCIETDTAVISVINTPTLDLGVDATVCEGGSVLLSVPAALSPAIWQDGSSAGSFLADATGIYHATAVFSGCTLSDTFELTVVPYPVIDLGNDTTICEGSSLLLDATTPNCTYLWSDGSTNATLETTSAGEVWVRVSNGGCSSADTIIISHKPLPPDPLPADTVICHGDTITVVLDNTTGASYEWYNGSSEDWLKIGAAGDYWVTSSLDGCERTDTLHVDEYPQISDPVFDSTLTICEGKSVLIGPVITSPLIDVVWGDGFTSSPMAVHEGGIYQFTLSTACETHDFSVEVTEERCFCVVYLPNAFTPDNKLGNEVFGAKYDCPFDRFELLVFNRWGEIVFSTTDPDATWDGTYNSLPVPDGVYTYKLTYTSPEMETYEEMAGHVSVLR